MNWKLKRGFTLIELLIVIAILCILAAIILPAFQLAREKARKTSCISNQKQIALAFQVYRDSYDDRFPGAGYGMRNSASDWVRCEGYYRIQVDQGALWGWVKNASVYCCPSDPRGGVRRLSYALNGMLDYLTAGVIRDESSTFMLIDEDETSPANDAVFEVKTNLDRLRDEHNGWGTVAYCDGHVKTVRPEWLDRSVEIPEGFKP